MVQLFQEVFNVLIFSFYRGIVAESDNFFIAPWKYSGINDLFYTSLALLKFIGWSSGNFWH